jgi:hypothetical protein
MAQPTAYRFLSASPSSGSSGMEYVPVVDRPPGQRISREPLDQYPYLRGLSLDWLDRYDESALDEVDEFLRSHREGIDRESAGHDLSVYLCNWVVVNVEAAYWVLDQFGTCYVELGDVQLDPYRHVVQCIADRRPVARRFVLQAWKLEPPGLV